MEEMQQAVIKGHENYVVKSNGEVWRLFNIKGEPIEPRRVAMVSKRKKDGGHMYVTLLSYTAVNKDGSRTHYATIKQVPVLYIVGVAFCKRASTLYVPMPIDGDIMNVNASNIKWVSRSKYIKHMQQQGRLLNSAQRSDRLQGIARTDTTRKNMSKAKRGIHNPNCLGVYIVDGKRFFSARKAADYADIGVKLLKEYCMNGEPGYDFISRNKYISMIQKEKREWAVIERTSKRQPKD